MKAEELRIGNLIYSPNGTLCKVGYEVIRSLVVLSPKPKFKPIPITEEWLVAFGFRFGVKLQDFVKGNHQFVEIGPFNGYFSITNAILYALNTKIKYIHQLQNIYFSLTENELTYEKGKGQN